MSCDAVGSIKSSNKFFLTKMGGTVCRGHDAIYAICANYAANVMS